MYAYIKGEIVGITEDNLVLECNNTAQRSAAAARNRRDSKDLYLHKRAGRCLSVVWLSLKGRFGDL